MDSQIRTVLTLNPVDWELIKKIILNFSRRARSEIDKIEQFVQLVQQKNLPSDNLIDLEHRFYLYRKDWKIIKKFVRRSAGGDYELLNGSSKIDKQLLFKLRKIFCYAYNEEGVSPYTLEDYFHWLDSDYLGGDERRFKIGNDYVEWGGNSWHYYERDDCGTRWYDNGTASLEYAGMILRKWLLTAEDVGDVMRTSPIQLDEILKSKAKRKPEEIQKALNFQKMHDWEILDFCYTEVSIRLFIQLGLIKEEDIAKALQEEYLFHFGMKPAVCSYDYHLVCPDSPPDFFLPGKSNGSERLFRRFLCQKDVELFLEQHRCKNAKQVLSVE